MTASAGPIADYRRRWLPELAALAFLALAATVLFSATDLDIAAARLFYRPELADPWPVASRPLWLACYRSAPYVTASLAAAGVALFLAGALRRRRKATGIYGIFLLLSVVLGPGLIVNGILKDHWGRPRPRQIVEFGGRLPYVPPLLPADTHGKSFPCGHCSVGYLYSAGWWVWGRRRPAWAAASLAAGTAVGTLLGIGRMAAGAHFLSDAVWSGLIAFGVAHALYYYVLRIPAREDSREELYPLIGRRPGWRAAAVSAGVLLGLGIVAGGLLATPHHRGFEGRIRLADLPALPGSLTLQVDTLDVEVLLAGDAEGGIECEGDVHGFGLPTNRIEASWTYEKDPVPALRYRVAERGLYTDIDGVLRVRVPARAVGRICVRVGRGDIDVSVEPGAAAGGLPVLDLYTAEGRVRRPSR